MTNNEILKELQQIVQWISDGQTKFIAQVKTPEMLQEDLKANLKELRRLKDVCAVLKARFDEEEK